MWKNTDRVTNMVVEEACRQPCPVPGRAQLASFSMVRMAADEAFEKTQLSTVQKPESMLGLPRCRWFRPP